MLSFVCSRQIPGWPVLCTCSFSISWLSSSFCVTTGSLEQSTCHKGEESCFIFQLMPSVPTPSATCHVSPCPFTAPFRTNPTSLATSFLCLSPVLILGTEIKGDSGLSFNEYRRVPFLMYLTVLSSILSLNLASSCHLLTSAVVGFAFSDLCGSDVLSSSV